MQTFMPYADFQASVSCLDYRRLGKQRVETKQILRALCGETIGWQNHPATLMWKGHEYQLARYGELVCREWISRGYKDTMLQYFLDKQAELIAQGKGLGLPKWMGWEEFHASHRSNLLRKDVKHYKKFRWTEGPNLPYFWPIAK